MTDFRTELDNFYANLTGLQDGKEPDHEAVLAFLKKQTVEARFNTILSYSKPHPHNHTSSVSTMELIAELGDADILNAAFQGMDAQQKTQLLSLYKGGNRPMGELLLRRNWPMANYEPDPKDYRTLLRIAFEGLNEEQRFQLLDTKAYGSKYVSGQPVHLVVNHDDPELCRIAFEGISSAKKLALLDAGYYYGNHHHDEKPTALHEIFCDSAISHPSKHRTPENTRNMLSTLLDGLEPEHKKTLLEDNMHCILHDRDETMLSEAFKGLEKKDQDKLIASQTQTLIDSQNPTLIKIAMRPMGIKTREEFLGTCGFYHNHKSGLSTVMDSGDAELKKLALQNISPKKLKEEYWQECSHDRNFDTHLETLTKGSQIKM